MQPFLDKSRVGETVLYLFREKRFGARVDVGTSSVPPDIKNGITECCPLRRFSASSNTDLAGGALSDTLVGGDRQGWPRATSSSLHSTDGCQHFHEDTIEASGKRTSPAEIYDWPHVHPDPGL